MKKRRLHEICVNLRFKYRVYIYQNVTSTPPMTMAFGIGNPLLML